MEKLTEEQISKKLESLEGWTYAKEAIHTSFKFENFKQAQIFANKLGDLAEKEFHHPVITFGWGYCNVTFQTNKIRGLHENDIIMAAKVNELI